MASPKTPGEKPDRSTFSDSLGLGQGNRLSGFFQSPPRKFFERLLAESVELTGALAGRVWALNDIGQLTQIGTTSGESFQPFSGPQVVDRHRALLSQTLANNVPATTPFRDAALGGLERVLYVAPLQLQSEAVGILELMLEQPPDESRNQELQQILHIASSYLEDRATRIDISNPTGQATDKTGSPRNQPEPAVRSSPSERDVEEFVLLLHNQSDLDHVAATTVNEVRRLVDCDRVCLATKSGPKCQVIAVSGQDTVVRKSNAVQSLRKLCKHAIETGREIRFEANEDEMEGNSSDLIVEYLDASRATWLRVLPLFAPEKIDFESSLHVANRVPFAALVIEKFSASTPPELSTVDRLSCHVALATWHAANQQEIFLVGPRRRLGQWLSTSRMTRSKVLIAIVSILLVASLLTFIKAPFRIPATGRLMPVQQFRAYAPFDGMVRNVWVESGQAVEANQVLIDVHSEILESRVLGFTNELAEKKKLLAAYKAQQNGMANQNSSSDQIALSAKIAQLSLETAGLAEQLQLNRRVLELSQVRSPMTGTIATFQPGELLSGRPVAKGELLLEVMDETGPWQIELQIPERRIGHLFTGNPSNRDLVVDFVATIDPEHRHAALVRLIPRRVSMADDGTSAMPMVADISPNSNLRPAIGAEVTARIQCGERSLGYVLFGDVLDWLSARFW